jgi:hypothetical protein
MFYISLPTHYARSAKCGPIQQNIHPVRSSVALASFPSHSPIAGDGNDKYTPSSPYYDGGADHISSIASSLEFSKEESPPSGDFHNLHVPSLLFVPLQNGTSSRPDSDNTSSSDGSSHTSCNEFSTMGKDTVNQLGGSPTPGDIDTCVSNASEIAGVFSMSGNDSSTTNESNIVAAFPVFDAGKFQDTGRFVHHQQDASYVTILDFLEQINAPLYAFDALLHENVERFNTVRSIKYHSESPQ